MVKHAAPRDHPAATARAQHGGNARIGLHATFHRDRTSYLGLKQPLVLSRARLGRGLRRTLVPAGEACRDTGALVRRQACFLNEILSHGVCVRSSVQQLLPYVSNRRCNTGFCHGAGRVKPNRQPVAAVIRALFAQSSYLGLRAGRKTGNIVRRPTCQLMQVLTIGQIRGRPEPDGGGVALHDVRFRRCQFFRKSLRLINEGCRSLLLLPRAEHRVFLFRSGRRRHWCKAIYCDRSSRISARTPFSGASSVCWRTYS